MKLHSKIFLGLIFGAIFGVVANLFFKGEILFGLINYITNPLGKMWLAALIMVVIPLIISSLALGVANIKDSKKLGIMGVKTFLLFLSLTAISTVFGLIALNLVRPGDSIDKKVKEELLMEYKGEVENAMGLSQKALSIDLLVNIIPRNPIKAASEGNMLAVIFCALILGLALAKLPAESSKVMISFLESVSAITIKVIEMVMKFAPVGVFSLIFSVMAKFGIELLFALSYYVAVVVVVMFLFAAIFYPIILKIFTKRSPWQFFKQIKLIMLTAFSTSSSNATLPTTMSVVVNELGVKKEVAGFVLPLGATMNMNGTALFEGVTVLFLAQVFGVELTLVSQLIVVLVSVITAIGVAGIPGGSIPLLMMVLGMVGVPMEGIAIILGVDRILDMCRTTINVMGDAVTAVVVNDMEE